MSCTTFKPHQSTGGSGVIPPGVIAHDLNAVMGKEASCEGQSGTAWINWATGYPADSKVFMSLVSDSGPWTEVYYNSDLVYGHEVYTPILAIDSTHYFYVESVSDANGLEK